MNSAISIMELGLDGMVIESECRLSNSLPSIIIVGLGGKAVEESKERIRSAFSSTGDPLPRKRITINLAPADIPKSTTSLDLAIAVSIMRAANPNAYTKDLDAVFIGELGLNGTVRPVRGVIGKILAGQKLGIKTFFIPFENLSQAQLIPGAGLYPVKTFQELRYHLSGRKNIGIQYGAAEAFTAKSNTDNPLDVVRDQIQAKRAITIAISGGHNILLYGPPGTGKSMLAKVARDLLPPLNHSEMLEVTHLHSLATSRYDELIKTRPFRAPHHTASYTSIVGGGSTIKPGEITLSHRGILLLDEFPEFSSTTLEALRQPLEERKITITRVRQSVEYPANFILIATANPCPCGYYGSDQSCICTAAHIRSYQRKFSGPILDRIDMHVPVSATKLTHLLKAPPSIPHEDIHSKIIRARERQYKRAGACVVNSDLQNEQIREYLKADPQTINLLNLASERLKLSARAYMKTLKVARTIADFEDSRHVRPEHISEALQYRKNKLTIE